MPWFGFAPHHHLGRFDNRQRFVAAAQLQFGHGIPRDDGGQRLIADTQAHLREQAIGGRLFVVRKGQKQNYLVRLVP